MPKYQVIRNVDIITEVTAKNKAEAIEMALEEEGRGEGEYCEVSIKTVVLEKDKKPCKGRFEVIVDARTVRGNDVTEENIADARHVENLDLGNIGLTFTKVEQTSLCVSGPRIILHFEVHCHGGNAGEVTVADLKEDIDEMIMWWGGNAWSYDNGPKITVKAI
jgi:hypothetical protein